MQAPNSDIPVHQHACRLLTSVLRTTHILTSLLHSGPVSGQDRKRHNKKNSNLLILKRSRYIKPPDNCHDLSLSYGQCIGDSNGKTKERRDKVGEWLQIRVWKLYAYMRLAKSKPPLLSPPNIPLRLFVWFNGREGDAARCWAQVQVTNHHPFSNWIFLQIVVFEEWSFTNMLQLLEKRILRLSAKMEQSR